EIETLPFVKPTTSLSSHRVIFNGSPPDNDSSFCHVAPPSLVRQTSLKIITKPKFSETKKMSRPKPFISVGIRPATAHVSPPFDVSQTSCSTVRTHPTKELRKKIFVSLALPNCSF